MKTTFKKLLPLTAMTFLAGCTVSGESEFDCPNPEKGICMSAQTAYEFAEDSERVKRYEAFNKSAKKNIDDEDEFRQSTSTSSKRNTLRNVSPVVGTLTQPLYKPKPVLKPAEVLRVWVNVYEDNNGVLHMPQTSFVEITSRTWTLGGGVINKKFKTSPPFTVVTDKITTNN
jgi:conjugal transfer pilus assembly protein TraV